MILHHYKISNKTWNLSYYSLSPILTFSIKNLKINCSIFWWKMCKLIMSTKVNYSQRNIGKGRFQTFAQRGAYTPCPSLKPHLIFVLQKMRKNRMLWNYLFFQFCDRNILFYLSLLIFFAIAMVRGVIPIWKSNTQKKP